MRDARAMFDAGAPRRRMRGLLLAARLVFAAAQAVVLWGVFAKGGVQVEVLPWDKAQHFMAFLGLMLLALTAFPGRGAAVLALALALEGGLIELIQATPLVGRDADVGDWLADLAGVLSVTAALIAGHVRLRLRQDSSRSGPSDPVGDPDVAADAGPRAWP
jgi:VanZ family protein